jgi:hypothetical protein
MSRTFSGFNNTVPTAVATRVNMCWLLGSECFHGDSFLVADTLTGNFAGLIFGRLFFFMWVYMMANSNLGLVMWDLLWTNLRWGRFSPNTLVSPASSHSTKYSILIYHPGLVQ